MIPIAFLQAWSTKAPWPDLRQVEQDLIICRALCDLFNASALAGKIAFRAFIGILSTAAPIDPSRSGPSPGSCRSQAGAGPRSGGLVPFHEFRLTEPLPRQDRGLSLAVRNMAKLLEEIHPGEILREDFMKPMGISARQLAADIDVSPSRISALVNGQRPITADTALRLGLFFGMEPRFWLNLQSEYDIRLADRNLRAKIAPRIRVLQPVAS